MPSKPFSSRSKEKEDAKEEKLANERERIRNKIFELEFKEIEVYMIENQGFGSGSACFGHPVFFFVLIIRFRQFGTEKIS